MIAGLLLAAILSDSLAVRDVRVAPGEVLRVTAGGTGPAVVFLPNLFGSAFGFRRLLGPLSHAGYRALVVEPLGTGFSSYPKHADYSLTAQSERVASILAKEGIRDAVMVGHGIGVSIALRLAYRHPERVAGVVGIDGGATETAGTPGNSPGDGVWAPVAPVHEFCRTPKARAALPHGELERLQLGHRRRCGPLHGGA
jgi:pimeloyl-ACP methyl ester carboxylesterase